MANNRHGEGSFFHDKINKRHIWRLRRKSSDGKTVTKTLTGKTKKELLAKVNKFLEDSSTDNDLFCEPTVESYMKKWLQQTQKSIKAKTYEYYSYITYSYIIPGIGNTKLADLKPEDITNMIDNLKRLDGQDGELSRSTKSGVRTTLRAALNSAVHNGYLKINPVRATKPPKGFVKQRLTFTEEEMHRILDIAENCDYVHSDDQQAWQENPANIFLRHEMYFLVFTAVYTGMRIGEILALNWNDISFDNGTINISKTVNYRIVDDPKSLTSTRIISMGKVLAEKLMKWKHEQECYADIYKGIFDNKINLVFPDSVGGYRNIRNLRRRYWYKLRAAAGLGEGYDFHSFRHYHATMLIKAGVPIAAVSKRLGHASVSITMNVYQHVIDSMNKSLDDALDKLLV